MQETGLGEASGNDSTRGRERRLAHRITPTFRTAKLVAGDIEVPCIVRDASISGVMVQLFGAIPEAEAHVLELNNGERFAADPVWIDTRNAGLRFHDHIELNRLLALSMGKFPKRPLRVRTRAMANIILGEETFAAAIENISQQGARIACGTHLAINQLVRVETGIVPSLYAKVRWRKQPDYGLVFERLLEFEELGSFAAATLESDVPAAASKVA